MAANNEVSDFIVESRSLFNSDKDYETARSSKRKHSFQNDGNSDLGSLRIIQRNHLSDKIKIAYALPHLALAAMYLPTRKFLDLDSRNMDIYKRWLYMCSDIHIAKYYTDSIKVCKDCHKFTLSDIAA